MQTVIRLFGSESREAFVGWQKPSQFLIPSFAVHSLKFGINMQL
jgi:hypothetical protein